MNEAGNNVANTAVGRSSTGQTFVQSARKVAFLRLLGLSEASAYRQPQLAGKLSGEPGKPKRNRPIPAEGKFDLSKFNS